MTGCVKCFDGNKTMSLKASDDKLLKKVQQNMGKSQKFNEYWI